MTDKSVVQLQNMLAPIKKGLDQISKRLEQHDENFAGISKKLDQHSKKLDQHDKNFAEISKKLDQHEVSLGVIDKKLDQNTGALVNIEDTIKIYGDMYQVNNDNARKLEKRINYLEDKNGAVAPPELKLTNVM